MANVSRVTAIWTGFSGEPGYSKFSFLELTTDAARNAAGAAIRTFFDGIKTNLPQGTTVSVQPIVDDLDIVSGQLMSSGTMSTTPTPVLSTAASTAYAGGSGLVITWLGNGIFNGHRIRGRTFIVPTIGAHDTNGTLHAAVIAAVEAAGNALIGTVGADLAIWNRAWTKTTPPVATQGSVASATGCTVRDQAAQLRSRRT